MNFLKLIFEKIDSNLSFNIDDEKLLPLEQLTLRDNKLAPRILDALVLLLLSRGFHLKRLDLAGNPLLSGKSWMILQTMRENDIIDHPFVSLKYDEALRHPAAYSYFNELNYSRQKRKPVRIYCSSLQASECNMPGHSTWISRFRQLIKIFQLHYRCPDRMSVLMTSD